MDTMEHVDLSQSDIVQEIKRGAWTAVVIDRNGTRRNHGVADSSRYMVRLDHPNGFNTEWPLLYDNGSIAYDMHNPPRDAQRATKAAYRWVKAKVLELQQAQGET